MVDRRLVTGIKGDLKRGASLAEIKSKYLARYSDVDIDEAILAARGIEVSKTIKKSAFYETDSPSKSFSFFIFGFLIIALIIGVYYYLAFIEECTENQYKVGGICVRYICIEDKECNDNNIKTRDVCSNPSTEKAKCIHENVKNSQTFPGTIARCGECSYLDNGICKSYTCCSDLDCNDDDENTIDSCLEPSSEYSACLNRYPFEETGEDNYTENISE